MGKIGHYVPAVKRRSRDKHALCPSDNLSSTLRMTTKPTRKRTYQGRVKRAASIAVDVGKRLRWAREVVCESAVQCARSLGMNDTSNWSKWERGLRYPDPVVVVAFCEEYGLTTDYVYRGKLSGVKPEVSLRLAAAHPELVENDPDLGRVSHARVEAPVT